MANPARPCTACGIPFRRPTRRLGQLGRHRVRCWSCVKAKRFKDNTPDDIPTWAIEILAQRNHALVHRKALTRGVS